MSSSYRSTSRDWMVAALSSSGAVSLLLITALASYYFGHKQGSQTEYRDKKQKDNHQTNALLRDYTQRRLEDRLSFHEMEDNGCSAEKEEEDQDGASVHSFAGELSVYGEQDCVKTQSNRWNHFEGFAEDSDSDSRLHDQRRKEWESNKARSLSRTSSIDDNDDIRLDNMLEGDDCKDDSCENQVASDDCSLASESRLNRNSNGNSYVHSLPTIQSEDKTDYITSTTLLATPLVQLPSDRPTRSISYAANNPPDLRSLITRRTLSSPDIHILGSRNSIDSSEERQSSSNLSIHVRQQHRAARVHYNARIMPDNVFLVRHGQSRGNSDENLYASVPDNAMPLTSLGWEQARFAGRQLKCKMKGSSSIHFIVSPYVRTVETFHGICSAWCDPSDFSYISSKEKRLKAWYSHLRGMGLTWHEDPRIREQDFGNYQDPAKIQQAKRDRHRFGAFYYRFHHGESASDVYDRVSTFLDSLWRSFDTNNCRNYVLVTHGIAIRVILTRYFRYSIDQFHLLANPRNCETIVLGHNGAGRLELAGRYELTLDEGNEEETHVLGCKFHRRLRVLPPQVVRKVKVRICEEED